MKTILLLCTIVLITNFSAEAQKHYKQQGDTTTFYNKDGSIRYVHVETKAAFVLAIKNYQHDTVQGYPTYAKCIVARTKAIKKDGKDWDCFPVNYD